MVNSSLTLRDFKRSYTLSAELGAKGQLDFNNGKYPSDCFLSLDNDRVDLAFKFGVTPGDVLTGAKLPDFTAHQKQEAPQLAKFTLTELYHSGRPIRAKTVKVVKTQLQASGLSAGLPTRFSMAVLATCAALRRPTPLRRIPQWVKSL